MSSCSRAFLGGICLIQRRPDHRYDLSAILDCRAKSFSVHALRQPGDDNHPALREFPAKSPRSSCAVFRNVARTHDCNTRALYELHLAGEPKASCFGNKRGVQRLVSVFDQRPTAFEQFPDGRRVDAGRVRRLILPLRDGWGDCLAASHGLWPHHEAASAYRNRQTDSTASCAYPNDVPQAADANKVRAP